MQGPKSKLRHWLHGFGSVVALGVFGVALWLLWHELREYRPEDICRQLAAIPPWRLAMAVGLTVANYVVLLGYDLLAMRAVGCRLPLGKVVLVSFTGFALSANLGALLGGTSARVRLYSAWGLRSGQIVPLIIMLAITYWSGAFMLAGAVFCFAPFPIPAKLHLPVETVRPLGTILLGLAGAFLVLTSLRRWQVKWGDVEFSLPTARIASAQTAVAAGDLALAAACLYVLLPAGLPLSYFEFLGIYLLAVTAAVMTHVPGGVGIFELVVLTFVAPTATDTVVASLLAFRVVYYLLPLFLALGLLMAHEVVLRWKEVRRGTQLVGEWSAVAAPWLVMWLIGGAGAWLLLASVTPIPAERLASLERRIPLAVLEVAHLARALIGLALLLLAGRGFGQSDRSKWLLFGLLLLAAVSSLAGEMDLASVAVASVAAGMVWIARWPMPTEEPDVGASLRWGWNVLMAMTLMGMSWLAMWWYLPEPLSPALIGHFSFAGDAARWSRACGAGLALLVIVGSARWLRNAAIRSGRLKTFSSPRG